MDKAKAGVKFSDEQLAWLNLIRDHIATAISIEPEDLELPPFHPNSEVASCTAGASRCSADILVCGFTGLSSPVFPLWNWRLESRQNPQAGKPTLPAHPVPTTDFGFNQLGGLGKAHQLFGEQLPKLLDELNAVLAA